MNSMPLPDPPNVVGGQELAAKQSAVDEQGKLRRTPIHDVVVRPTRPVPHEDGHVTEVARASWDIIGGRVVQVHLTTTLPGRHRAWGLHQRSTDRLFVVSGLVKFAVYDGRLDSPTYGCVNEVTLSEKNPALLIIPPNLYHGWKNIGTNEAIIINMPTAMYNYEAPDALDLPWDSEACRVDATHFTVRPKWAPSRPSCHRWLAVGREAFLSPLRQDTCTHALSGPRQPSRQDFDAVKPFWMP